MKAALKLWRTIVNPDYTIVIYINHYRCLVTSEALQREDDLCDDGTDGQDTYIDDITFVWTHMDKRDLNKGGNFQIRSYYPPDISVRRCLQVQSTRNPAGQAKRAWHIENDSTHTEFLFYYEEFSKFVRQIHF